ncbi:MAG: heme ABC exporter ATP-binding protein CcmA [Pseudomonadota bacterium]
MPLASIAGLACRRGDRRLFEGLDLRVAAGEALWLRGRNGCGKTSLLRLLAGFGSPDSGHLLLTTRVLYIGHTSALHGDLTSAEALAFLLDLQRAPAAQIDSAAVLAALSRIGLRAQADVSVRGLSQGQRRRVALARLAAETEPSLWLLDEPFDALDADAAACVTALMGEHLQRGGAAIVASHQAFGGAHWQPRVCDLDRLH